MNITAPTPLTRFVLYLAGSGHFPEQSVGSFFGALLSAGSFGFVEAIFVLRSTPVQTAAMNDFFIFALLHAHMLTQTRDTEKETALFDVMQLSGRTLQRIFSKSEQHSGCGWQNISIIIWTPAVQKKMREKVLIFNRYSNKKMYVNCSPFSALTCHKL